MKSRKELIAEGLKDANEWYRMNYELIKIYQEEQKKTDLRLRKSVKNLVIYTQIIA
ncbi:hypothetical protein ACWOEY_11065 [Enterococcus sulfureus]